MFKGGYYYLASPYSHPDPALRAVRFHEAQLAAWKLMQFGVTVYSPIAAWHPAVEKFGAPTDADSWWQHNKGFLFKSDGVIVLTLAGWKESIGVGQELEYAKEHALRIYYASREGEEVVLRSRP
jgi:hypothetical protein